MITRKKRQIAPVHPGEILKEEFMVPLEMSANRLSLLLRVPSGRITQIINGQRAVTTDTALRLSRLFGTTAEFWMNLQNLYDLQNAEDKLVAEINEQVKPLKKTAS
jgi:addiction module HigA family antidote